MPPTRASPRGGDAGAAPQWSRRHRKYFHAYSLSLQNVLQLRSSLLMDRIGGLALITTLYFFWSALLGSSERFLGYDRAQMLSYVLAMNVLRSLVFTGRGWEVVREISSGRIASALVRPVDYRGYCLSLDLGAKSVHAAAAVLEVAFLIRIFDAPVYVPVRAAAWVLFLAAATLSSLVFFLLEFMVASLAFWTSESAGPLFCFELFVQFAAGAFFPLDVLPRGLQLGLRLTPFPALMFLPLQIYLERIPLKEALSVLLLQGFWCAALLLFSSKLWRMGLDNYAAEGG